MPITLAKQSLNTGIVCADLDAMLGLYRGILGFTLAGEGH